MFIRNKKVCSSWFTNKKENDDYNYNKDSDEIKMIKHTLFKDPKQHTLTVGNVKAFYFWIALWTLRFYFYKCATIKHVKLKQGYKNTELRVKFWTESP